MGRTAVHTQEQVFQAADQLAANGQEVTPNALRDLLGRGSYSTFVKHIAAWEQTRQAAPVPVVLEMPENVKAAFANCWQAAATEAGKEIAAIREKADGEIKAIKRRLDEALAAITELEVEQEADASRLEVAETQLAAERDAAHKAATEAAAREAALAATNEQMRQQLVAQQTELARLHAEHTAALNSANSHAERLGDQLAEAAAKVEAISARERERIEEAATAKAEAARLNEQLKDQKTRSADVITKLENSKQGLEAELVTVSKEAREAASKLGRATGELEALRTQVASQQEVIKGFSKK